MSAKKKMFQAAAGNAGGGGGGDLNVEDVFSTYLYAGAGATDHDIENGINLGQSNSGGSADFSDGSSYVYAANSSEFTLGDTFTIEAWIWRTDSSDGTICGRWYSASGDHWIFHIYNGGKLAFGVGTNTDYADKSSSVVPIGQWVHVAVSNTSSSKKLFINGVNDGAFSGVNISGNGSLDLTFGANTGGGSSASLIISNLRIVKGTALYSANFTPPTSALTAVSGTSFLGFQGDQPLVDNSSTGHSILSTSGGDPESLSFGPFTAEEAGAGGMVWIKNRTYTSAPVLFDTERGANLAVSSNSDSAEIDTANSGYLSSFNSNGFTVKEGTSNGLRTNTSGANFASWTFRKAPKFFDVVTYTGTGVTQTISHNLGAEVGCIMVKNLDSAESWQVYHRGLNGGSSPHHYFTLLDSNQAEFNSDSRWNDTAPTSTEFTVATDEGVNESGSQHIAYLFAHNDGDGAFGFDGDQDIIKCGSWNHNGDTEVDLGFEPQWILVKDNTGGAGWWTVWDSMRGLSDAPNGTAYLAPHLSNAEASNAAFRLTPTGFVAKAFNSGENLYIAIRRGTKVPESGTEVFYPSTAQLSVVQNTGFDPDLYINMQNGAGGNTNGVLTRLISKEYLRTDSNAAHVNTNNSFAFSETNTFTNTTFGLTAISNLSFKRAPKFFDVVGYYGNGTAGHNVSHNLGVTPEMMWVKRRDAAGDWQVYHSGVDATSPEDYFLVLNEQDARTDSATRWNDTAPTSTEFTLGTRSDVNASGGDFVAYLFASLDGVSKVGSYTATGSAQTIDCGFDGGPRFVMIKCATASSAESWYVYDTARGINPSGTADKRLALNVGAGEVSVDEINPTSSGFEITGTNTPNVSGEEYIFYAIA